MTSLSCTCNQLAEVKDGGCTSLQLPADTEHFIDTKLKTVQCLMRYETQILEAYERLDFKPRGNQVQDIDQILVSFLDEGFQTIILSAPTGVGKSVIGAVVAETIHRIKYPSVHAGASFLLTPTNMLSAQYHDTFQKTRPREDTRFRMIKGAANFNCSALSTPEEPQTAEVCAIGIFQKQEMHSIIDAHCNRCEYQIQRRGRDKARHLILNYAYYFVDRMWADNLAQRTVCVFDEAHLINDLFTEHNAIYFSNSRLQKMAEEIQEALSLGHTEVFKIIKEVKSALNAGMISDKNYLDYLGHMYDMYKQVSDAAKGEADRHARNPKKYLQISKIAKKYFGLGCKIGDLMTYNYPHAFEYKPKDPKIKNSEDEVSVKPIFVGDMFNQLIHADYNLLMSATLSNEYARQTLTLENAKHIRLDPTFPKENKKVIFFKPLNLNFNTLKDPKVVKQLQANVYEIVKHHTDQGERGIVLAPSFILTESVTEVLHAMKLNTTIFEHQRGEKLAEVLERFKKHTRGSAVLLTPSGFEGLDLPGELSRFQVILKCPFGNLGEARMKKILAIWPNIYSLLATMKLTQGAGRSVRGPEDYAITYMLDSNIQRLWTAKNNEWSGEFLTTFSSLLE
jgi:ATP-dependent DNA helicase DinG